MAQWRELQLYVSLAFVRKKLLAQVMIVLVTVNSSRMPLWCIHLLGQGCDALCLACNFFYRQSKRRAAQPHEGFTLLGMQSELISHLEPGYPSASTQPVRIGQLLSLISVVLFGVPIDGIH